MSEFKLQAPYQPTGDQPQAIDRLVRGFREGNHCETLLGVTGSGKTFTMANVIQQLNKPTLIIAHNKTLAAQLYGEFKEFFPENAVEYFVSYYDYYQPEAYVPSSDTYIAKDSSINDEIDKLRLSATTALAERRDVIIISSVSCIYGLGSPVDYKNMVLSLRPGMERDRDEVIHKLIDLHYDRNDMDFHRGTFRVHGDVLEIFPAESDEYAYRVEFFGDEIDRITEIDVLTGKSRCALEHIAVFPASHYVVPMDKILEAAKHIEEELDELIVFRPLEEQSLCSIAEKLLGQLEERAARSGYQLTHTARVGPALAAKARSPYGARELRRQVDRAVEQAFADQIASGSVSLGQRWTADCTADGTIVVEETQTAGVG
mgnify:CR=1 FL=1